MLNHVSTLIFNFKFIKIIIILNLHAHKNIQKSYFPISLLFKILGCYTFPSPTWATMAATRAMAATTTIAATAVGTSSSREATSAAQALTLLPATGTRLLWQWPLCCPCPHRSRGHELVPAATRRGFLGGHGDNADPTREMVWPRIQRPLIRLMEVTKSTG
jgi:hypothetical protein